jgi:glycerophosphoryl diester phosphodiesterase
MTPKQRFRKALGSHGRKAAISVHRGLWGPAPENSRAAIFGGSELGIVEFDIQLAADAVPVVMHDDTLDRMTGISGAVSETPAHLITSLRLREGDGGSDASLTNEKVPLLDEILHHAPKGAYFDFDAKNPGEIEQIAAYIAARQASGRGSVKIDTLDASDVGVLCELERRHGMVVMAKVVLSDAGIRHIVALRDAGVAAAEVYFDSLEQLAEACSVAGDDLAISTYTLDPFHCCGLSDSLALADPRHVWGQLVDVGVSVIMTDRPCDLARFMDGV